MCSKQKKYFLFTKKGPPHWFRKPLTFWTFLTFLQFRAQFLKHFLLGNNIFNIFADSFFCLGGGVDGFCAQCFACSLSLSFFCLSVPSLSYSIVLIFRGCSSPSFSLYISLVLHVSSHVISYLASSYDDCCILFADLILHDNVFLSGVTAPLFGISYTGPRSYILLHEQALYIYPRWSERAVWPCHPHRANIAIEPNGVIARRCPESCKHPITLCG